MKDKGNVNFHYKNLTLPLIASIFGQTYSKTTIMVQCVQRVRTLSTLTLVLSCSHQYIIRERAQYTGVSKVTMKYNFV
jgi:hypothetical protein